MTGVTVVMPSRGPAPYLAEALASLGGDPDDVIVVEDGTHDLSTDRLAGAQLLRLPYVGRSAARNAGVEAARTPLVAFLDSDDIALPGRIERQRAVLAAGGELCFGRVSAIGAASEQLPDDTASEARRFAALLERGADVVGLLVDCPIFTSATMTRRESHLAIGGYDPLLDAYEDLDLYLRVAARNGLVACPGGPVTAHRRHPGNTPSDHLYAGAFRLAQKHRATASGEARRLLLERQLDSLWGLGDFRRARLHALDSLRADPRLLANPRFRKRLVASAAPRALLERLRG